MGELEIDELEKMIDELKTKIEVCDGQIRSNNGEIQILINNNPQIQILQQVNNKLVVERHQHDGAIQQLQKIIKMKKGEVTERGEPVPDEFLGKGVAPPKKKK